MNSSVSIAARKLLRMRQVRRQLFDCAKAGKQYTVDLLAVAPKPVAIAAVRIAAERLARRAAAAVVQEDDLEARLLRFKLDKRRRLNTLHAEDIEAFEKTISGVFRTATSGDHYLTIDIEPLPSEVGAVGRSEVGSRYSRQCRYYKTDSRHAYRIPPFWQATVKKQGLAILDGMVTLRAEVESERTDGIVTYAAVWARQGRGFSLETNRGWIARCNGITYHSDRSPAAARSGLRQKMAWQVAPANVRAARLAKLSVAAVARAEQRQKQMDRLTERLKKYDISDIADVEVTYEDSRKAGNCHDGTVAFGERLFGDDRRKTTIGEMVQRLSARGEDAASLVTTELGRQFVAACLRAIRRHRNLNRRQCIVADVVLQPMRHTD